MAEIPLIFLCSGLPVRESMILSARPAMGWRMLLPCEGLAGAPGWGWVGPYFLAKMMSSSKAAFSSMESTSFRGPRTSRSSCSKCSFSTAMNFSTVEKKMSNSLGVVGMLVSRNCKISLLTWSSRTFLSYKSLPAGYISIYIFFLVKIINKSKSKWIWYLPWSILVIMRG